MFFLLFCLAFITIPIRTPHFREIQLKHLNRVQIIKHASKNSAISSLVMMFHGLPRLGVAQATLYIHMVIVRVYIVILFKLIIVGPSVHDG